VTIGVRIRLFVAQTPAINFDSRSFRKLIVLRAKMNLSVSTPILCVLLVALLSEVAYARPADWLLRYFLFSLAVLYNPLLDSRSLLIFFTQFYFTSIDVIPFLLFST